MKNNNQLMMAISINIERLLATTVMCSEQPNSDYIEFENGKSFFIGDIQDYRKEYNASEIEGAFEDYLVEQVALYIDNKRDLPN